MKKLFFQIAYWATSILTGVVALPLLVWPNRKPLMRWIRTYSSMMVFWMEKIHGIDLEVRARSNLPGGPCIIAAKHQSWGDGFCMFSQFDDLAFVTSDHLEKLPLVGKILRKMEAIVVAQCGGAESRARLIDTEMENARKQNRKILIYPEGRLVEPGYHGHYRKGVFHMYEAYDCAVVPVATNLGLFWPGDSWDLKPGHAVVEFLEPIAPGKTKDELMGLLQKRIETASLALLPAEFDTPQNREWIHPEDLKRAS